MGLTHLGLLVRRSARGDRRGARSGRVRVADIYSQAEKDGVILYGTDPARIRLDIARARREQRGIDHSTARRIATWVAVDKPPSSPIYTLAATGEIPPYIADAITEEINASITRHGSCTQREWLRWLLDYANQRPCKCAVEDWLSLAGDHDAIEGAYEPSPYMVWIASTADYERGIVHGHWIDIAQEPKQIEDDIAYMLAQSSVPGATLWEVMDIEGFQVKSMPKNPSIQNLANIGETLRKKGS